MSKIADIYVSNSEAGFINRFSYIEPHFRVVYNGLDFSRFSNNKSKLNLKKEIGLTNNYPILGSVASLTEHKDHFTLFHAFKSVLKSYPTAALVLVGDGDKRIQLEESVKKLNITQNTFFLGFRQDVDMLYQIMDVHILCTNVNIHYEGISNALIEAMVSSIPVIATDGGGTKELIKNGFDGILIRAYDPEHLAKSIIYLLKYKDEAQLMSQRASTKIQNLFSLERYITDYTNIYKEILAS